MSITTNEFHRHHARAAERCWETRRYLAAFGHGFAALSVAPWRGSRRFSAASTERRIWELALWLFSVPNP